MLNTRYARTNFKPISLGYETDPHWGMKEVTNMRLDWTEIVGNRTISQTIINFNKMIEIWISILQILTSYQIANPFSFIEIILRLQFIICLCITTVIKLLTQSPFFCSSSLNQDNIIIALVLNTATRSEPDPFTCQIEHNPEALLLNISNNG